MYGANCPAYLSGSLNMRFTCSTFTGFTLLLRYASLLFPRALWNCEKQYMQPNEQLLYVSKVMGMLQSAISFVHRGLP